MLPGEPPSPQGPLLRSSQNACILLVATLGFPKFGVPCWGVLPVLVFFFFFFFFLGGGGGGLGFRAITQTPGRIRKVTQTPGRIQKVEPPNRCPLLLLGHCWEPLRGSTF